MKRIQFKNFWPSLDPKNNYFTELLTKYSCEFEIVDTDPDIIIFSVFGPGFPNGPRDFDKGQASVWDPRGEWKFIKDSNSKKVHYTGENSPPVKQANLNLTFDLDSKYNNIRFPLYLLRLYENGLNGRDKNMQLVKKESEGFCCFVYSNPIKFRNEFCKKLSKYKNVDCGGGCLNNVGGKVKNKIEFQKKYKFCIAFENSLKPGYTTEKIFEAYQSNCIPIYYGSTAIKSDFNPETFINAHDFDNDEDLIDYIKKVDTDESLYNSYMNKPVFTKYWLDIFNDPEEKFFKNVVEKIME